MPAEIRYIVFSADEITAAIEKYAPGSAGFPSGPIVSVETTGNEDTCATVLVREKSAQFTQVHIASAELLSFMIRVCRDARVPLPARAPKRLCLLQDRLALAIKIDARKYRPNPVPRPRTSTVARARFNMVA